MDNYTPRLMSCSAGFYLRSYCEGMHIHLAFELLIIVLVAIAAWAATFEMAR